MPTPQISRFGRLLSKLSHAAASKTQPTRAKAPVQAAADPTRFRHLQAAAGTPGAPARAAPSETQRSAPDATAAAILKAGAIRRGEASPPAMSRPATAANQQAASTAAAIIAAGKRRRGEAP